MCRGIFIYRTALQTDTISLLRPQTQPTANGPNEKIRFIKTQNSSVLLSVHTNKKSLNALHIAANRHNLQLNSLPYSDYFVPPFCNCKSRSILIPVSQKQFRNITHSHEITRPRKSNRLLGVSWVPPFHMFSSRYENLIHYFPRFWWRLRVLVAHNDAILKEYWTSLITERPHLTLCCKMWRIVGGQSNNICFVSLRPFHMMYSIIY